MACGHFVAARRHRVGPQCAHPLSTLDRKSLTGTNYVSPAHSSGDPVGPFAMWPAFPASNYYGPAAPPHGRRRTTRSPAVSCLAGRPRTGTLGWFPRSPQIARRVRCPAMPLRHRHATPQAFTVASRPASPNRPRSSPPAMTDRYAPQSGPYPPGLSWPLS
jgi:hypothetical protein